MKELHYYAKLLELGRISRREFIGRASVLGLAASVPGLILSEEARAREPEAGRETADGHRPRRDHRWARSGRWLKIGSLLP